MDYKNGKIYKVQFDDGHFYIGSTATELRKRFWEHKGDARQTACTHYMKQVGKDTCRIVLIEDYPCKNKDELRKKEDEHIQLHYENVLCLNILRAFVTPEEAKEKDKIYREAHNEKISAYREDHREEHKAYMKTYQMTHNNEKKARDKAYREEHKEEHKAYMKAYREKKKNQIK